MSRIAEISNRFSIFDLKRGRHITPGISKGMIKWTYCGQESSISFQIVIDGKDDYMRLTYNARDSFTGESREMDTRIDLCETSCNYGGHRYWFICPECKRRCGTLFLAGKWFLCRECGRVLYYSQTFKIVSGADIDRAFSEIKRFYYKGNPTRKYRKYLRLKSRSNEQSFTFLEKWGKKFNIPFS